MIILKKPRPLLFLLLISLSLFFFSIVVVVAIFLLLLRVFLFAWLGFCILNRGLDLTHHTTWGALGEVFSISILGRLVGC